MFRIKEGPSSGSLVQHLDKITRVVLSCPLTWTLVILTKYCTKLPDDGSSVIRNMLDNF